MENEPIILGIETALKNGSLSILKGTEEIASYVGDENVGRSENLLQAINSILNENNLILKDIDLLAVSTGPGSFTGIRAGIATAQALITGLRCRYVGVSVLEALAFYETGNVISVIPSGRSDQYTWQLFSRELGSKMSELEMGSIDILAKRIKELSFENLLIAVESSIIRDGNFMDTIGEIIKNNHYTLKIASDNVAKLICLKGSKKIQSLLLPKYMLEVEIGNKR